MSLDADDMRIHVLGIGNIGSLFAFHLRRALPASSPIALILRKHDSIKRLNDDQGNSVRVERDGHTETATGYEREVWDVKSDQVFSLMYDRRGAAKPQVEQKPLDPYMDVFRIPGTRPPGRPNKPDYGTANTIDSLILTVKATSALSALQRIVPRLHSNSTIVLLQNGMGVYDQLVDRLFPDPEKRPHFVLASTTHGAWQKGALHVVHAGMGDFSFGIVPDPLGRRDYEASLKNGFSSLQLSDISADPKNDPEFRTLHGTIQALLSLTDLKPVWDPYEWLQVKLMKKLCVNCCVNPLTALMDVTNGELLGSVDAYNLLRMVCHEAWEVFRAHAQAAGPPTTTNLVMANLYPAKLEEEVTRVIGHTAKNFSSMLQDIRNGRVTEIEYMNGYLIRLGRQYGLQTPVNHTLRSMVRLRCTLGAPTQMLGAMKYWHPLRSIPLAPRPPLSPLTAPPGLPP
ncbi:hypothetical protein CALCODRAFT_555102, partial [Calocera cornea HHB12733]